MLSLRNSNIVKADSQMSRKNYIDRLFYDPFETLFGDLFTPFDWGMEYKKNENGTLSISVDVPGIKESDISIEISDNIISVKGERKTTISSYSVHKKFNIPEGYSSEDIKAELDSGVLTLTLNSKQEPNKEIKKIPISTNK